MEYIEVTARTLNDAITEACQKLVIPSNKLDYEVISQGSAGFLGIGSKPVIIKAREKSPEELALVKALLKTAEAPKNLKEETKEKLKKETKKDLNKNLNKDSNKDSNKDLNKDVNKDLNKDVKKDLNKYSSKDVKKDLNKYSNRDLNKDSNRDSKENSKKDFKKDIIVTPIYDPDDLGSKDFLNSVFQAMNMQVSVNIKYDKANSNLDIDLSGGEMGVLIGKRGQTLDSLQYLTSLVVNRGKSNYIRVKVDTEDYRNRRKETLENLAKNIAYKVKRGKRSVSLEPMNPYERRVIHSALQDDKYVTTHSEGDEPYRRVVVTLKK